MRSCSSGWAAVIEAITTAAMPTTNCDERAGTADIADCFADRHGFWGYIQTSPRAFWDPMATSPFSEASYCKVLVPRPTHKRGKQSVAHDREPVERAAFRGSDGLEPPKSVTVRSATH